MPPVRWEMMVYQCQDVGIKVNILSSWQRSRATRGCLHETTEWKLEDMWRYLSFYPNLKMALQRFSRRVDTGPVMSEVLVAAVSTMNSVRLENRDILPSRSH